MSLKCTYRSSASKWTHKTIKMIQFNSEDISFSLKNKTKLKNWIVSTIEKNPPRTTGSIRARKKAGDISFVFCSDAFLLKMNKEYLNHDTYTDIITFDYSKDNSANDLRFSTPLEVTPKGGVSRTKKTTDPISGDIFISIDRVKENASNFSKTFEDELHRVIIHGVLHLLGYKDKTKIAKAEMRKQEDICLKALKKI